MSVVDGITIQELEEHDSVSNLLLQASFLRCLDPCGRSPTVRQIALTHPAEVNCSSPGQTGRPMYRAFSTRRKQRVIAEAHMLEIGRALEESSTAVLES